MISRWEDEENLYLAIETRTLAPTHHPCFRYCLKMDRKDAKKKSILVNGLANHLCWSTRCQPSLLPSHRLIPTIRVCGESIYCFFRSAAATSRCRRSIALFPNFDYVPGTCIDVWASPRIFGSYPWMSSWEKESKQGIRFSDVESVAEILFYAIFGGGPLYLIHPCLLGLHFTLVVGSAATKSRIQDHGQFLPFIKKNALSSCGFSSIS